MIGWGYLIGYGYLAVLLFTAEFLVRRGIPKEITRKVLHCLIGFEWLVLYFFFADSAQIIVIPATFVAINAASYKLKFFKSIERETDNHPGTIFYALAMTAMSVATACDHRFLVPFGIATFCLSFGDGAAALAGKYLRPNKPLFGKSVNGTLFCYIFAYIGQIVLFAIIGLPFDWALFAAISAVCALSELLAGHGMDNLTVCAWCCTFAFALLYCPALLAPLLMCFGGYVLAYCTHYARLFSSVAAITACIMLATIGLWAGWLPYLAILGCYALTAIVERVCGRQHHHTRHLGQVLQNGLAAWVCALVYHFWPHPTLLYAFVIAVAQSMCDSTASAIGATSPTQPIDIVRHKRIACGLSGGITARGTVGSLLLCAIPAFAVQPIVGWHYAMFAVALLPWLGMLLDSVLGATLQRKYKCDVCGQITECTVHCGRPSTMCNDIARLRNGDVNLICNVLTTLVGAIVCFFLL